MKKKSKKKPSKYTTQKYASFNTKYQVGVRRELLDDIDYIDKLSDEEKDYLNRFLQETVVANFNHGGENIIKDTKTRREIYRENNRRNKDVYSLGKSNGSLFYTSKQNESSNPSLVEDIKLRAEEQDDMENLYNTVITIKDKLRKK